MGADHPLGIKVTGSTGNLGASTLGGGGGAGQVLGWPLIFLIMVSLW